MALLGGVSVILASLFSVSYTPGLITLLVLVFLAIFGIFSFVILGLKTMNFFNPTPLLTYLDRDFISWASFSAVSGLMWHDKSFQNHYHKQAIKTIVTYENVMSLLKSKPMMGSNTKVEIIDHILVLLRSYAKIKLQIPSDSYWFLRIGENKDWLMENHTALSLALSTRTGLQQDLVPLHLWVENELRIIVKDSIVELIESGDWETVVIPLDAWQKTLQVISSHWGIAEAIALHKILHPIMRSKIILPDDDLKNNKFNEKELAYRLGILDMFQLGILQITLGFTSALEQKSGKQFGKDVSSIDFRKTKSIYQKGFPRDLLLKLEEIQKTLELEFMAEGEIITAKWYLQQMAAAEYSNFIKNTLEAIISDIEFYFVQEAESFIKDKCEVFAAQTCMRGMEAYSKAISCVRQAEDTFSQLDEFKKEFGFHLINIQWAEPDWTEVAKRLREIHTKLLVLLSKTVYTLMHFPVSKQLPDMFGRTYSELAQGCFSSLLMEDEDAFNELFPAYFLASVFANQRILDKFSDQEAWRYVPYAIDPVIDVMEISGYAYAFTELSSGNFWKNVKKTWDRFLSIEDKDTRVKALESAVAYKEGAVLYRGTPRDLLRTSWQQKFEAKMREFGIEDDISNSHFGFPSKLSTQPVFIQAIAPGTMGLMHHDLYTAFLAIYFDEASPVPEFQLPKKALRFQQKLERIRELNNDEIEKTHD